MPMERRAASPAEEERDYALRSRTLPSNSSAV